MYWDEIKKKEMSMGQLIRMALNIFKQNKKAIMLITFIIFIPINIATALIPLDIIMSNLYNVITQEGVVVDYNYILNNISTIQPPMLEYLKWYSIAYGIKTFFGCIALMGVAFITYQFIEGNEMDYKVVIEETFPKWLSAILTIIISGLFIIGFYMIAFIPTMLLPVLAYLTIIPIVIFLIYSCFMLYSVAIKRKKGLKAIRHSFNLVKGRFWRTAGKLFFIFALQGAWEGLIGSAFSNLPSNEIVIFIGKCCITVVTSYFWVLQTIWFLNYEATCKEKLG